MKIAIATKGTQTAGHFGHCEAFTVYTIDGANRSVERLDNPGHKPGFLPNFLNDLGVKVIISGGMGAGAVEIFKEKGIQVITGATGPIDAVVQAYVEGTLTSTNTICNAHQHRHHCGEHKASKRNI
ncbi:NifB/NifX family molybdenum-iron cluster-binding protein [Fusibacter sp. JL298sf-3]